jgi:hypothetical protein
MSDGLAALTPVFIIGSRAAAAAAGVEEDDAPVAAAEPAATAVLRAPFTMWMVWPFWDI